MPDSNDDLPDWNELPSGVLAAMKFLGNFSPTVHAHSREVKGCMMSEDGDDCRVYLDSGELRDIASACNHVADWLDNRAEKQAEKQ